MLEFVQSIPSSVPWLLFLMVLLWSLRLQSKLTICTRERHHYYMQRNGLAIEIMHKIFPSGRREWVRKYPPPPGRRQSDEHEEVILDFTPEEVQYVTLLTEKYLDGEIIRVNAEESHFWPRGIRIHGHAYSS